MNNDTGKNNLHLARLIIKNLIDLGVSQFIISPGSRSTPLTLAVAQNDRANSVVHYDERGAGFFALGIARATGQPAVLICTSGTAVANYFPALIESSMDQVPLFVLSADRPPELIDSGANQTIYQDNMFGKYTRYHGQLESCSDDELTNNLSELQLAYHASMGPLPGPVHLNCMFSEPLVPLHSDENNISKSDLPTVKLAQNKDRTNETDIISWPVLIEKFKSDSDGLIVVARHQSVNDIQAIEKLSALLGWPILPDITSGMRFGRPHQNVIVHYDYLIDDLISSTQKQKTILHFGSQPVSKQLQRLLSVPEHSAYIHVGQHLYNKEPYQTVTNRVSASSDSFCQKLIQKLEIPSSENRSISHSQAKVITSVLDQEFTKEKLTEPAVARKISELITPESCLFVASSRPIRDMDQFAVLDGPAIIFGSNRGASGIDGTIATAAGFAKGYKKPLTILIGDLALLHDLNSLSLVKELKVPVVITVINNNGGGIFSFLPVRKYESQFEKYFGTPHDLSFESAAKMFNLDYVNPTTHSQFVEQYKSAQKKQTVTIIEINTDRDENITFHKELYKTIREALNHENKA